VEGQYRLGLLRAADDLRGQAITSGPSSAAKAKLVNTPELKEQRNATMLYVFAL
jgi:hypothetical protein